MLLKRHYVNKTSKQISATLRTLPFSLMVDKIKFFRIIGDIIPEALALHILLPPPVLLLHCTTSKHNDILSQTTLYFNYYYNQRLPLPLILWYSKISKLRPPLGLSKSGLKDHFWTVPKVVSNQRYTGCRNWRKE